MGKKVLFVAILISVLVLALVSCGHEHEWKKATCTDPKVCNICGETEGNPSGHSFKKATCKAPKTCSACGKTEGTVTGHNFTGATCKAPKTCQICGITQGDLAPHTTNQGRCGICHEFINLLNDDLQKIRIARNNMGDSFSKVRLQVTLHGKLNIDFCNEAFSYIDEMSKILANNPKDFLELSDHFDLLLDKWSVFAKNVNAASSENLRVSCWKEFNEFLLEWENTYFTISSQYYPPR